MILEVNNGISNETTAYYVLGVEMGIINPKKYTLETFEMDERNTFKHLYREYSSFNVSRPLSYQDWLIQNNFGILTDTQESLLKPKFTRRDSADNSKLFINAVRKGDILISGESRGGLLGHAALMTTDYWVLEMRGGSKWAKGIPDNNRELAKDKWFEKYSSDWVKVYRCPYQDLARDAAVWADRAYRNPTGGSEKTVHITYYLTDDLWEIDPSYDSKLVIQAFYFGTGKHKVVKDLSKIDHVIFPINIPKYFHRKYKLNLVDEF